MTKVIAVIAAHADDEVLGCGGGRFQNLLKRDAKFMSCCLQMEKLLVLI
jgi:LmbE family N-acetylglucosaminyl deacetylase